MLPPLFFSLLDLAAILPALLGRGFTRAQASGLIVFCKERLVAESRTGTVLGDYTLGAMVVASPDNSESACIALEPC